MPAKSKSQQRLFGMALAVRRGELKRSDVDDAVLDIVDGDMTDKQIRDFAKTKNLKEHLQELLNCQAAPYIILIMMLLLYRYKLIIN